MIDPQKELELRAAEVKAELDQKYLYVQQITEAFLNSFMIEFRSELAKRTLIPFNILLMSNAYDLRCGRIKINVKVDLYSR